MKHTTIFRGLIREIHLNEVLRMIANYRMDYYLSVRVDPVTIENGKPCGDYVHIFVSAPAKRVNVSFKILAILAGILNSFEECDVEFRLE